MSDEPIHPPDIDGCQLVSLFLGRVASYYYLKYTTAKLFSKQLKASMNLSFLSNDPEV